MALWMEVMRQSGGVLRQGRTARRDGSMLQAEGSTLPRPSSLCHGACGTGPSGLGRREVGLMDLNLHIDHAVALALCGFAVRLLVLWHRGRTKR